MKIQLFLALFLVISMIGLGSAVEESEEQLPGRALTQDEVMAVFGNSSWIMPEELRESIGNDLNQRKVAPENEGEKPLTPEKIAEINAKAPEGMILVTGIEDIPIQKELSISTQVQDVKVKGDEIILEWPDSDKFSSVISVQDSTKTTSDGNMLVVKASRAITPETPGLSEKEFEEYVGIMQEKYADAGVFGTGLEDGLEGQLPGNSGDMQYISSWTKQLEVKNSDGVVMGSSDNLVALYKLN